MDLLREWAGWLALTLALIVLLFILTGCATQAQPVFERSSEDVYIWRAQTESLLYPRGYLD